AAAELEVLLEAAALVAEVVAEALQPQPGQAGELLEVEHVGLPLGVAQVHGDGEGDLARQVAAHGEPGAGIGLAEHQDGPQGEAAEPYRLGEATEDVGAEV